MKNLFRFCSLMLSWAVCVNVLAVSTPVVVANPMQCDGGVSFTVTVDGNYDPSILYYSWSLNKGTGIYAVTPGTGSYRAGCCRKTSAS